jgi:hypothetical protein
VCECERDKNQIKFARESEPRIVFDLHFTPLDNTTRQYVEGRERVDKVGRIINRSR